MSNWKKAKPCLSYNNTEMQDGTGAQLQRILAIYGVSAKYGFGYHHSSILRVEFNPGNSGINESELVNDANGLFQKVSKCNLKFREKNFAYNRFTRSEKLRKHYFNYLKLLDLLQKKHSHYSISDPYLMIEKTPDFYRNAGRKLMRIDNKKTFNKDKLEVKMHIIWAKVSKDRLSNRFTNLDWYREIWNMIVKIFGNEFSINLTIHTDAPSVSKIEHIRGFLTKETSQYWKEENILNMDGKIILNGLSEEVLHEYFGKCKILRDEKPSEIIKDLANSEILIMAKSSLSFVAGVMNENNTKIYSKFWHNTPLDWIEYELLTSDKLIHHLNKLKIRKLY